MQELDEATRLLNVFPNSSRTCQPKRDMEYGVWILATTMHGKKQWTIMSQSLVIFAGTTSGGRLADVSWEQIAARITET